MTWDTYRSTAVMPTAPNWASPLTQNFITDVDVLQFLGIGRAWSQQSETGIAWEAEFLLDGRAAIQELRDAFDARRGRWGVFWAPTWQGDVKVTAAILATDTVLNIEDMDYGEYWGAAGYEVTGRYLMIRFPDGSQVYRRVLGWPSSTSLTLDAAVGTDVALGELGSLLVSFLLLARFDQDELLLEYLTEDKAKTKLRFRAVAAEGVALMTTTTTTTSSTTTTT